MRLGLFAIAGVAGLMLLSPAAHAQPWGEVKQSRLRKTDNELDLPINWRTLDA